MMGRQKGRLCLLYQVDFDVDTLSYSSSSAKEKVSGTISSFEELYSAIDELLEFHKTDRLEIAFKLIKGNVGGMCAKSFPMSALSIRLIGMLNLCMGGENGVQLLHLPFAGTLYDQPNLFIEAYYVYLDEHSKYIRSLRKNETNRH